MSVLPAARKTASLTETELKGSRSVKEEEKKRGRRKRAAEEDVSRSERKKRIKEEKHFLIMWPLSRDDLHSATSSREPGASPRGCLLA